MRTPYLLFVVLTLAASTTQADSKSDDIQDLRNALSDLRSEYEARISDLEQRLSDAEDQAEEAQELAEDASLAPIPSTRAANDFNPAISLVLVGNAAIQTNNKAYSVPGFSLPGEAGPADEGFSLGESELNINSNIDDKFYGNLTVAIAPDGAETAVELEEAFFQTLAMPAGITLTAGRFFSGVGYLNGFHSHADDFNDRPVSYEVFLGGQFKDDGLKITWQLPTDHFFEVGGELLRGNSFPSGGSANSGAGTWTLFAATGGDIGLSNSWKAGMGYIDATVEDRATDPTDDTSALFTGDSKLVNLNFVWKWSPLGNPVNTNFKIQGEYFSREEDGLLDTAVYKGDQTGWYLQGDYKFLPQWKIGYRHGNVDADNRILPTVIALGGSNSVDRDSFVLEWINSEFSSIKLQYTDQSGLTNDSRWLLRYVHSLGAHGAHQF